MSSFLDQYKRQPKLFIDLPSKGASYDESVIQDQQYTQLPVFGMNTMDEILIKTPDALFSGEATAEIIKSCVPMVKDPWKIMGFDLDYILLAIRMATYGDKMPVSSNCPMCDTQNDNEVMLTKMLEKIDSAQLETSVKIKELTFKLQPLTYKRTTDISQKHFTLQTNSFGVDHDASLSPKEMISLEKMFTFMKGDIAKSNSLISSSQIDSLIKAAQNSFVNAEGIITNNISKLSAAEKAKLGKPINLLQNLNTLRTETQGMFDDVFTASMIKQAQSGASGFIEADKVVKHFVIGGRHKELLRLIHALPQSERAIFKSAIARETFDNALNTSKNNITGNYDGKAFLNHWMAIGDDTKTTLFGSNKVQIERLAKDIAAKNGKFTEAETRALLNSDESQLIKL